MLANEANGTEKQISLNTTKIQELVSGTFTNNGFIIIADTELNDRFNYKSSDASTASQRPKLVIQYTTATSTPGPSPTPTNTPSGPTQTPTWTPTPSQTLTVAPTTPPPSFQNATFVYDGDGKRVKSIINNAITTYFVGSHYEVTGSTITKYYYAGAQRIAMRSNDTLQFLVGDHLGSTSLTTSATGTVISELRYKAWGEVRSAIGNMPTQYQYTGQYSYEAEFGLYFYNARWYDPYITQFSQPDSIIPDLYNPLDWNRYAYARYNPLKYTDPTGHDVDCGIGDQFCSDLKHEMVNSDWQKHLSFKRFMSARDAYYYYYNHPDKAIDADLNLDGDYDVGLSYSLGSIYSEDVLHQAFQPYGMDTLFDRIETARQSEDFNLYWALIFGFGLQEWMDSDDKGGGGYGLSSTGRGLDTILQLDDVSFMKWARASKPVNNPFSVDEANAIWTRLEQAGVTPVLDLGHSGGVWTGPHINVRGTSIHIPVVPEFKP